MDDKGIQGFTFTIAEMFTTVLPLLALAIFDVIMFPVRLVYNTVIPDSVLY